LKSSIELNIDVVIDEYSKYVYKIINNIVGDNLPFEDKEEIASDIFYLFWKNSKNIKTNLKAYLATIARHCSYEKLRNKKIDFLYDEQLNIVEKQDFIELLIIKEKINSLNNEEKRIVELYYFEGMKIKEIAKMLHKKNSSIKIRLYRIRKKLKEEK